MMKTILLIEDNIDILNANCIMLELNGYSVLTALTLEQGEQQINTHIPDLIVLDIMLPDGSGIEFCQNLRQQGLMTPILYLSARNRNDDIVKGLRNGGDDYLTKPYDYDVLLAHIEALLRRTKAESHRQLGPFTIDQQAHRVYRDGKDLMLKPREFLLLQFFADNIGIFFPPHVLYERLWVGDATEDVRTVYAHISSLRRKMALYGSTELQIEHRRGAGYRLIVKQ